MTDITGKRKQTFIRVWNNGTPNSEIRSTITITCNVTERSEVITDNVTLRPEVTVDPKTLKWTRIRYPNSNSRYLYDISGASRLFGKNRSFRPVQSCNHVKSVVDNKDFKDELTIVLGNSNSSWTNEWTRIYDNAYLFYMNHAGSGDPAAAFSSSEQAYSAGAYKQIDWYALTASFEEACESFTKQKFLAGEALYENKIFIDAFKILLNPTRALPILVKNILQRSSSRNVKKFKRMKLGEFARSCKGLTKSAVNAHLSYDFAVKPAIEDIKATLDAHSFVSNRMKFLRQHAGSFVPIRVKQELSADISNGMPSPPPLGQATKFFVNLEYKYSIGHIGAWARVREDLDWDSTWSAYLQYFGINKMVGLVWELIPFSFVIDWVTNAQEHINSVSRLRTGGPFCGIRSVCASLKEVTRKNLMFHPGYDSSLQAPILKPVGPQKLGSFDQVSYYRYTSIPTTSGLVDFSNLGSFHYTKLAELVFQFFAK